ncbi:MAG: sel1 repeat family protein [Rhodobacteraceae bacterium]|nr:sel1 repeat family protein [Paracoccaceae bacterium]
MYQAHAFRMAALPAAIAIALAGSALPIAAQDGVLNPEEGGISHLTESLSARPEMAGFACWAVYEAQKGGLHAEATEALKLCAQSGNAPSMILLSHAYENGQGVEKDDARATYWVKQAALQGYSTAQYHYALALLEGRGVPADAGQAIFWLDRAAMGGDTDAAHLLASLPQG